MSYYKNRINFEVFHALTDGNRSNEFSAGTGAELSDPGTSCRQDFPGLKQIEETNLGEKEEDSFSQYYSSKI